MQRREFLEISPYQADEGELIGKHPGDVPSDFLSLKLRAQNPLNAIREKCLDCCCANVAEVRKCVAVDCPLWPYRIKLYSRRERIGRGISTSEFDLRSTLYPKPRFSFV
jgi:hypothetical protein